MVWSERQRAMLEVMGLRVWSAPAAAEPNGAAAAVLDEVVPAAPETRSPAQADATAPMPVVNRRSTPAAQPIATPVAAPGAVDAAGLDWPALRKSVGDNWKSELLEGAAFDPQAARVLQTGEALAQARAQPNASPMAIRSSLQQGPAMSLK